MCASTETSLQATLTPRLDIWVRLKSGRASSITLAVLFFLLSALTACATKSAYTGHRATDLSAVKPGVPRTTIESTIGQPEKVKEQDTSLVARYVIDRGYFGTLETNSLGEKRGWAPMMAWGELLSFGLAGWMVACATPCQKGWLVIVYDNEGRVREVSEDFLPDGHPLVEECAKSAVRADIGVCQYVRESVRPSSLPRIGVGSDSDWGDSR